MSRKQIKYCCYCHHLSFFLFFVMLRRLRELSRKGLQLLAESSNIGPAVVGSHALKALPAKQKTAWRPIVARLQLLRDLVAGSLVITFDLILLKCLTLLRKDINIFMLLRVFCAKRFSLRLLTAQKNSETAISLEFHKIYFFGGWLAHAMKSSIQLHYF